MADDISLQIKPTLDLSSLEQQGAEAGKKVANAMNKNGADAGKSFVTNINKAHKLATNFEKQLKRLEKVNLTPNRDTTKFLSDLAVERTKVTDLSNAYQEAKAKYEEMFETHAAQTKAHKKLTYLKKDVDAAKKSMEEYGAQVGQQQRYVQQLEDGLAEKTFGDKYGYEDQSAANQARIEKLRDTLIELDKAYQAAFKAKAEYEQQQKDKALAQEAKEQDKFNASLEKRQSAYEKASAATQKYINTAFSENATLKQVETAISQVQQRMAELSQMQASPVPGQLEASVEEYQRLSVVLTELVGKYDVMTNSVDDLIVKAQGESASLQDVAQAIDAVRARIEILENTSNRTVEQESELQYLKGQLVDLGQKYDDLNRKANSEAAVQAINRVTSAVSRLLKKLAQVSGHAIKSAFNTVRKSITGMGYDSNDTSKELQSLIRNVIKYGFGVRSVYFLYRRLRTAMVEALKDMAKFDTTGLGSSIAALSSSLQYLKSAWAAAFSPIVQYVTPVLVQLMDLLANVGNAIAALFATLTGRGTVVKAVKQQKSLADALGKTGSAAGGAADALGKLADFDELNIIGNDSGGGGGGGGGGSGNGPDGSFIVETIENELADLINADKWFEIGQLFADKLNTLTEAADNWINDVFRPWGVKWATNLGNFMNGFIYHYNWELLGKTFADGINAIFDTANTWFTTVNWSWFGSRVADGLISAINTIDWTLIGETLGNKLNKTIDFLYGFVKSLFASGRARQIADAIADGIYSFFTTIHWDNLGETLSTGFNGIIATLKRFIQHYDWDTVGDTIANAFNTAVRNIDAKEAGRTFNTFILKVFDQLSKIDLFAVGEKIGNFIASIDWLGILQKAVANILKLLAGVVVGAFKGEYGGSMVAAIVAALVGHFAIELAKIKIGTILGGKLLGDVLANAGIGGTAAAAGGATSGLATGLSGIGATVGPILGVAAALGGVAIMLKQSTDWLHEYDDTLHTLDETTQGHIDQLDLLIQQAEGYHDASVRQMDVYDVENERVRTLADSYLALFDENGKVKEGMQERADYYYNQLASALGLEDEQLQNLVNKHGDLKTAIEEVITAKTQDRAVSAYLDEYQFALDHVKEAQDAVTTAEQDHQLALEHKKETQQLVDKAQQDYMDHLGQGVEIEAEYKKKLDDAVTANGNAEYAIEKTKEQVTKANDELLKINATAEFYEGYIAAIATNDTNLINAALKRMQDGFITAEEGDRQSLERQAANMENYYELLLHEMEEGNPNVTQEMLDNAGEWVKTAHNELSKLDKVGSDSMDDLKSGMSKKKNELVTEAENTSARIASTYKNALLGVLDGVNMGTPTANLPVYSYAASGGGKLSPQRTSYAKLATGAVLPPNDPFLAIVGDQKHGTNVEAPLSTIEDAVRNVIGSNSNYSPEVVELLQRLIAVVEAKNFSLSKREVASAVISEINNERKRTGNTPILG